MKARVLVFHDPATLSPVCACVKFNNRRVEVHRRVLVDGPGVTVTFLRLVDKQDMDGVPCTSETIVGGKVKRSVIGMSEEAFGALFTAYLQLITPESQSKGKHHAALDAIGEVFRDETVPRRATIQNLQSLRDEIDVMMDTLKI